MTPQRRRDLVRSFVLTGGRSRPTRNTHVLDVITMVTSVPDRPLSGLGPEQAAMVELCRGGYLSVVEVAGHLGQPLTITRVLLADLLDSGHLVTRTTHAPAETATATATASDTASDTDTASRSDDAHILERLLHGLNAL
ncbi:DUF742 domain-containing protein [Streptomyces sp. NPDC048638]|uniref:DUF742 domain-containing protein n=1 Tax=Streptomyces sp. NPDC048638 TaxID=3365580 RepID=UPI003718AE6A